MNETNIDEQVTYLMQGTEYGDESLRETMTSELRQRLVDAAQENRPLRVYCGYDPRTTDLHLGHTVTMRKLRQFQELGHEVTFLIGNYTSLIGDPSDHDKLRPQLTPEQVMENGRTYADQAFRILDADRTVIQYNADWLSQLSFSSLIKLASNFTIQQFLTREAFRTRWDHGDGIYLHETFYSVMQGFDAYSLRADVQVGGTDQLFNIVTAARKVMTFLGEKPNIAIILGILPGTDGIVKMSKSLGNHIPINTTAKDMYGKIMSVPDIAMRSYLRLVTRWNPVQIDEFEKEVKEGKLHPRDAKMRLAHEIVSTLYSDDAAQSAEEEFIEMFQRKNIPAQMDRYVLKPGLSILEILLYCGLVKSKSEGKRLVEQKGVRLDGVIIEDPQGCLPHPGVLQIGKRVFIRIDHSE